MTDMPCVCRHIYLYLSWFAFTQIDLSASVSLWDCFQKCCFTDVSNDYDRNVYNTSS